MPASREGKWGQGCCTESGIWTRPESHVKVLVHPCQALMMLKVGRKWSAGLIAGVRVAVVTPLTHMYLTRLPLFLPEPGNRSLHSFHFLPACPSFCTVPGPSLAPTVLRTSQAQWPVDLDSSISWPALPNAGPGVTELAGTTALCSSGS